LIKSKCKDFCAIGTKLEKKIDYISGSQVFLYIHMLYFRQLDRGSEFYFAPTLLGRQIQFYQIYEIAFRTKFACNDNMFTVASDKEVLAITILDSVAIYPQIQHGR
jgi:hypothetical protein